MRGQETPRRESGTAVLAARKERRLVEVEPLVDLRSDTVTRPSPGMRDALARAEVGDDVFGDDPTVQALETRMAEITGKEAALYVVSGTMGNQLAIRSQIDHGDEVILDRQSHIYNYEAGAAAALSGAHLHPLDGPRGRLSPSALLCLENTHNRAGGAVVPLEALEAASDAARSLGLAVHLDGARLWNASAATGNAIARYAAVADTVMLCFSKALGAPVGSALAGSREVIRRARRFRKMFGGGIRQGGVLAAACLYALDHHRQRLTEDHARARRFAEAAAEVPGLEVPLDAVETNIVLLNLTDPDDNPAGALDRLRAEGVRLVPFGSRTLRAVFHLDIDDASLERAVAGLRRAFASAPSTGR
jgi:threonine aldolase